MAENDYNLYTRTPHTGSMPLWEYWSRGVADFKVQYESLANFPDLHEISADGFWHLSNTCI